MAIFLSQKQSNFNVCFINLLELSLSVIFLFILKHYLDLVFIACRYCLYVYVWDCDCTSRPQTYVY